MIFRDQLKVTESSKDALTAAMEYLIRKKAADKRYTEDLWMTDVRHVIDELVKKGLLTAEGEVQHAISKKVWRALQTHPSLKGKFSLRDPRFETRGICKEAHRGYQDWHRKLDDEVAKWLARPENQNITPEFFESWLKRRYCEPDLKWRFPEGF